MGIDDLRSLYLRELKEVCDCGAQVVEDMPTMAELAGSAEVRLLIWQHVEQTVLHGHQIEAILRRHGTCPRPGLDQVAAALVRKARQIVDELLDPDLRNAALVAVTRRIVGHRMAAYSAAESYAEALYLEIDRHSLLAILREEGSTDQQLASLQNEANQIAFLVSPSSCQ